MHGIINIIGMIDSYTLLFESIVILAWFGIFMTIRKVAKTLWIMNDDEYHLYMAYRTEERSRCYK